MLIQQQRWPNPASLQDCYINQSKGVREAVGLGAGERRGPMWPGRLTALGALGARPDHYSLLTFAGRHFARRFSELLSAEIPGANGYYLSIGPAT